mmetsp:Transcript_57942/g.166149  ORF Transcript_57942/g.166149 Transcript_57942/m.166149 type:complete len:233 (-) Transcript_57942:683-1381(-)
MRRMSSGTVSEATFCGATAWATRTMLAGGDLTDQRVRFLLPPPPELVPSTSAPLPKSLPPCTSATCSSSSSPSPSNSSPASAASAADSPEDEKPGFPMLPKETSPRELIVEPKFVKGSAQRVQCLNTTLVRIGIGWSACTCNIRSRLFISCCSSIKFKSLMSWPYGSSNSTAIWFNEMRINEIKKQKTPLQMGTAVKLHMAMGVTMQWPSNSNSVVCMYGKGYGTSVIREAA